MRGTLILLFYGLIVTACSHAGNHNILSPDSFEKKLEQKPGVLLDVRTSQEFGTGYIHNAKNADINSKDFLSEIAGINKSEPVYIYCQRGGRSESAAEKLKELGFREVYELEGGLVEWQKEGKAVEGNVSATPPDQLSLDDYKKLVNSYKIVVVDFWASWCGPCRKLSPLLEKLEKERPEDIKVIKINADVHEELTREIEIEALPTLIWYKNGKQQTRTVGLRSEKELNVILDKMVSNP